MRFTKQLRKLNNERIRKGFTINEEITAKIQDDTESPALYMEMENKK